MPPIIMDVDEICRICLLADQHMLMNVLEGGESLARNVESCFQVQISNSDQDRSKMICVNCVHFMNELNKQRETAANSQRIIDFLAKRSARANTSMVIGGYLSSNLILQIQDCSSVGHGNTNFAEEPIIPKSNQRILQSNTCPVCILFISDPDKAFEFNVISDLCPKHANLHTCLIPGCMYVFANKDAFMRHLRIHMKLTKHKFLCRTCFVVLNCARKLVKDEHTHEDPTERYRCCSIQFNTMMSFVLHKAQNHTVKFQGLRAKQLKNLNKHALSTNSLSIVVELFTCIVPDCNNIYNIKQNNCDHFREHNKLPKEYFLCNVCLKYSLDNTSIQQCDHSGRSHSCESCKVSFSTLEEFALHKLHRHDSVILCGVNKLPGCPVCGKTDVSDTELKTHYNKCFFKNKKFMTYSAVGRQELTDVPRICEPVVLNPKESLNGNYPCPTTPCSDSFDSVDSYILHMRQKHNLTLLPKDPAIRLCPLCDRKYLASTFRDHVNECTNSLKVHPDLNSFGCTYCNTIMDNVSPSVFRNHLLFCKTFVKNTNNHGVLYYKCKFCTYEDFTEEACAEHANKCIYYLLKERYEMESDEKQRVDERLLLIEKLKQEKSVANLNGHSVKYLQSNCNLSRQELLDNKYYFCKNCNKHFFNEKFFVDHMNDEGRKCRLNDDTIFCCGCQTDFSDEMEYLNHNQKISFNNQFAAVPDAIPITTTQFVFKREELKSELEEENFDYDGEIDEDEVLNNDNDNDVKFDYKIDGSIPSCSRESDVSMFEDTAVPSFEEDSEGTSLSVNGSVSLQEPEVLYYDVNTNTSFQESQILDYDMNSSISESEGEYSGTSNIEMEIHEEKPNVSGMDF